MIKITDIQRAFKETLQYTIPNAEVVSFNDAGQEVQRPYFCISFVRSCDKKITSHMEKKNIAFEIEYFASDFDELLGMQDILSNLFKTKMETLVEGCVFSFGISSTHFAINKENTKLKALVRTEIVQSIDEDILNNANSRLGRALNTNNEILEELVAKGD